MHDQCPSREDVRNFFTFHPSDNLLVAGTNLLAIRGRDRGDVSFLDVQVTAVGGGAVPDDHERVRSKCHCAIGQPVDTHSGNYWTTVTDLSVQTPGPELTWTRFYASQAVGDTTGVLGYGWQTPYLARLILPTMPGGEAGTVIVFSGNTNRERFLINADGTYTAFQGIFSTFTLNYQPGQTPTADVNVQTITYYDGAGNPIWQRDGFGRWTKTEYDSLGRPAKTIVNYQNGSVSANEATDQDLITIPGYDNAGRVTQQITNWVNGAFDPLVPSEDRITTTQYDTLGRMFLTTQNASTSIDAALNRISKTLYDPAKGRVIGQRSYQDPSIAQAVQRWSNQQYDGLGRTIKTIQNCTHNGAPQDPSVFACDSFTTSFTDRNVPTQTTYDALNRVTDTTDALSQITHTQYDGLGRVLKTIQNYKSNSNNGNYSASTPDVNVTTSYRYDALGRTLAMTDTLGNATRYAVNALGQTSQTTDQVGRVTTMGYDGSGTLR